MKKVALFLALLPGVICSVRGQLLLVENFDYPVGDLITAHGWIAHSGTENPVTVTPASIAYYGYLSSGTGNEILLKNTGEDDHKVFPAQDSGAVYAAFLVNIVAAKTTGDYFIHLGRSNIGTTLRGKVFVKKNAEGGVAFGITQASSAAAQVSYTPFSYALNTTYLLVLKYTFTPGPDNDVASLFINPVIGLTEPLPTITNTDVPSDPADIGSFSLRQGTVSSAPELKLDGIRVGLRWENILPPAVPAQTLVTGVVAGGETRCFNATQTITVAGNQGNFVVQPGGKVTLVAGRKIIFKPGTKILNGASLEGYITATSGYCSSLAPFIASEEKKEALIPAAQPGSSVFKIYPNPTNGIISLEINETESVAGLSVTIYRITGEPILKKELNPRFHQSFDLSSQPAGIYIMQIAGNNLSEVVKIIKR